MNELQITEYKNIRVLTTQQIAEAYGSDTRVISNNFNRNKDRYVVGKHYICLEDGEKRDFIDRHQIDDGSKKASKLYLWTEKGAFLHAKSLNTDTACLSKTMKLENTIRKIPGCILHSGIRTLTEWPIRLC